MQIIGLAKPHSSGNQNLIVILSEVEADKITGVAGKPHTPHRYKAGATVNINEVYNKVKFINENMESLKTAIADGKSSSEAIENALPLEDSP